MTSSPRGTVHRCTPFCGGCILGKNDFIFPYGSKRHFPLLTFLTVGTRGRPRCTGLRLPASASRLVAALASCWPLPQQLLPVSAAGCGRRRCNSRTGQIKNALARTATPVDIPIGWDPNTKKEPTGLFFSACGRPCSFDSSYGLHDAATTVDVPTGWDPRANQSPTGALVTVLCTAALFDSRTGHEKNPPSECSRDFMTRTGIEPMLQP